MGEAKSPVSECPAVLLYRIRRGDKLRVIWQPFVDRANAIRLLKALVAAGANSKTLMAGAWVDDVALKAALRGTALASALAYAEGQGWIGDGVKKGWMTITRAGERAARLYVVGL